MSDPTKALGSALLCAEKDEEGPWEKKAENRARNQFRILFQKYKISTCNLFYSEKFL